jgi:hypothetical protein
MPAKASFREIVTRVTGGITGLHQMGKAFAGRMFAPFCKLRMYKELVNDR